MPLEASSNTTDTIPSAIIINSKCLLFNNFSYIIQASLVLVSFSVLIYKRYREQPRRPWKIWFFDVSKQMCSACSLYMLNLLISVYLPIDTTTDQCIWYFINLLNDTTLGVFFCYAMIKLVNFLVKKYHCILLQSGLYFDIISKGDKLSYHINKKMYFAQLSLWLIVISLSKMILFGINIFGKKLVVSIGTFLLTPILFNKKIELIVVIVVPLVFNGIQFWVFDEMLKLDKNDITPSIALINEQIENNIDEMDSADHSKNMELVESTKEDDKDHSQSDDKESNASMFSNKNHNNDNRNSAPKIKNKENIENLTIDKRLIDSIEHPEYIDIEL